MSGPTLIAKIVPRATKKILGKDKSKARISMPRLFDQWQHIITPADPSVVLPNRITWKKLDEKTLVVDSKIPVHEFCRIVDVDPAVFAHLDAESETLGGLLQEIHADLPKLGDQIQVDPFTFTIEAVDHKRIKKIRVNIHEQEEQ